MTKLIELGVVDTLLNFIKTSSTTNTPLTHVSVNCLRNFSISGKHPSLTFSFPSFIPLPSLSLALRLVILTYLLAHNKKKLGEGQVIPTLMYLIFLNLYSLHSQLLALSSPSQLSAPLLSLPLTILFLSFYY